MPLKVIMKRPCFCPDLFLTPWTLVNIIVRTPHSQDSA